MGTAYLAQSVHVEGWDKIARVFSGFSIALVIVSYSAFALGGFQAYFSLLEQLK
jgi:hypothetical protein